MFLLFCLAAVCFSLAGLCTVVLGKVPRITGSAALIVTLAAFGLAIIR
ncbi:hypothetical protein OG596_26415 [Streptomyces sp. NBC_01102]|nr:hypothetical protein OG596_26415 [Streptomyces sp. NBC_01102]